MLTSQTSARSGVTFRGCLSSLADATRRIVSRGAATDAESCARRRRILVSSTDKSAEAGHTAKGENNSSRFYVSSRRVHRCIYIEIDPESVRKRRIFARSQVEYIFVTLLVRVASSEFRARARERTLTIF